MRKIAMNAALVVTALNATNCGKNTSEDNSLDEVGKSFMGAKSLRSDYFVDLKGVDTAEKRKPVVIYYAVNQSAEPMMAIHVTRDLQRLRKLCSQGIDSVAYVNSHFAEAKVKDDKKFFIKCENKRISAPFFGDEANRIKGVMAWASKGKEPSNSKLALKYTDQSRKYAAEFAKVPYAHPEVMKILLEHATRMFPSDKYTYFLHIKSHGAQATGGDQENALLMTGLTDDALRGKRWGNPSDKSKEGQIHTFVANGVFKSQRDLEKALGGYREVNGKLVFVNGGREGLAQTLNLDKTAEKGSLSSNCAPTECLSINDFKSLSADDRNSLSADNSATLTADDARSLDVSSSASLDISNGYSLDVSVGGNTGMGAENYFGTNGRIMKELLSMVFTGNKALKFAIFESCSNAFGRGEAALKDLKERVAKNQLNMSMFYSPTGTLAYENIKWDEMIGRNGATTPALQYSLITVTNEVKAAVPVQK